MKLIVGLGNPGATYAKTRHNLGWMAVTALAASLDVPLRRSLRFRARTGEGKIDKESVVLFLPATYMNRSGEPVARWVRARRFPLDQMLVVVDDLQLPLGQLRIRGGGSEGGHQGLKSLITSLGSTAFPRLRLGIGAPQEEAAWEEYVLQPFRRQEETAVREMIGKAVSCCRIWVTEGLEKCASLFNSKVEARTE